MKSSAMALLAIVLLFVVVSSDIEAARPNLSNNSSADTAGARTFVGKKRPEFTFKDLQGQPRSPANWDGKVVVVNFWATWCVPCRKEIPFFNALQKEYGDKGVQFVGIAIDDQKAVERFIQIIPIEYPVLIGNTAAIQTAQAYGNVAGALPFTAFIDRTGHIAAIATGGLTEAVTRRKIEELL